MQLETRKNHSNGDKVKWFYIQNENKSANFSLIQTTIRKSPSKENKKIQKICPNFVRFERMWIWKCENFICAHAQSQIHFQTRVFLLLLPETIHQWIKPTDILFENWTDFGEISMWARKYCTLKSNLFQAENQSIFDFYFWFLFWFISIGLVICH